MIDVTSLPFVSKGTNGERHCFWANEQSSDKRLNVENLGTQYATMYLEFERTNPAGPILGLILNDMIEAGDRSALAKVFIRTVGWAMFTAIQNATIIPLNQSIRRLPLEFDE